MTIALGLMCRDGIVLGADREVTLDTLKVHGKKVHIVKKEDVQVGLTGAGIEDLITYAAQRLRHKVQDRMSADDVRDVVVDVATEIQRYPEASGPENRLDLLVGIKTSNELRLLKMLGSVPTWRDTYQPVGYGSELAHHLCDHLYGDPDKLTVSRGIILAAHVLKEVKQYAKFCGGRSDIISLRRGYHAFEVPENDIVMHQNSSDDWARSVRPVMLALTDLDVDSHQLDDIIGRMQAELHTIRTNEFIQRQQARFKTLSVAIGVGIAHGHGEALGVSETPSAERTSQGAESDPDKNNA